MMMIFGFKKRITMKDNIFEGDYQLKISAKKTASCS